MKRSTDALPDIYKPAPFNDGWVSLATDLKNGDRVRLIDKSNQATHEVLEVADGKFRTDFKTDGDYVFVYGREVKDFRSVDYDAIAMLNVSATQELHRLVRTQAARIADLEQDRQTQAARTAKLENRLDQLLATQSGVTTAAPSITRTHFVPARQQ